MFKKILCLFLVLSLSLSVFILPVSASFEYGDADTPLSPSINTIREKVLSTYGINVNTYDYYMNTSTIDQYWPGLYQVTKTIYFIEHQPGTEIHITNPSATSSSPHNYSPFKIVSSLGVISGYRLQFTCRRKENNSILWDWDSFDSAVFRSDSETSTPDATNFDESNLPVFIGDENVNQDYADLSITFNDDDRTLSFDITNLTADTDLGWTCGIYSYQEYGLSVVAPGQSARRLCAIDSLIENCVAHNQDYADFVAYINVYDGINVVDSLSLSLGSLIDGADFYGDKQDLLPMPDPADYFDNPPEMPEFPGFPDFPDWDPDHPWQSLFAILQWLGECISTPFLYLFSLLGWVVETFVFYAMGFFSFLRDSLWTVLQNIMILLGNLVVDIKGLFIRLFVPRKLLLDYYIDNHFPIIEESKTFFSNLSISGYGYIDIPLFFSGGGDTMHISAIDAVGASNCSSFRSLSTWIILAFTLFAEINLFGQLAGLVPTGGGTIE